MKQQNDDLQDLQVIVQQQKKSTSNLHQQNDDLETLKKIYETVRYNSMTFELRKKMECSTIHHHNYNGYHMKIIVSANGHGEGDRGITPVSICLHSKRGKL